MISLKRKIASIMDLLGINPNWFLKILDSCHSNSSIILSPNIKCTTHKLYGSIIRTVLNTNHCTLSPFIRYFSSTKILIKYPVMQATSMGQAQAHPYILEFDVSEVLLC